MRPKRSPDAPEYFSKDKVCEITGLSKHLLSRRISIGQFPKPAGYVQVAGDYAYRMLFLQSDVYDWIKENGTGRERRAGLVA